MELCPTVLSTCINLSFIPSSLLPSQNPLIQPVITPRFAPTCSPQLLKELGELAKETGVHIQSHICEQKPEVEFTLKLFPGRENCASIFEESGLLTEKVCPCMARPNFQQSSTVHCAFLCMSLCLSSDCNGTLYPFGGERGEAVQEKRGWHFSLPLLQPMVQKQIRNFSLPGVRSRNTCICTTGGTQRPI